MKKYVEIMKMLIINMVVAVMIIPSMSCNAATYSRSVTELKPMIGNWYDENGNLALTITNDYKINGCTVLDIEILGADYGVSTYKLKILEKNGYRDIIFDYYSSDLSKKYNELNYHEMIVIDKKTAYLKMKNKKYYESIGGIYLGMSKNQVIALYGNASSIKDSTNDVWGYEEWEYKKEGFKIVFNGNIVGSITIYQNGNMRFDKSGLSANDSIDTYKRTYKPKFNNKDLSFVMYIGYGEEILINDRVKYSVTLTQSF